MGVRHIDDALFEKIKGWVKDENMTILKPNETARLFQVVADKTDDKPITLPLIALSRDSDIDILQTNKRALSFSGGRIAANQNKTTAVTAIPINVRYQLDIYTKEFWEADEYLRNFIFNIINYPKMTVHLKYNGVDEEHVANVRMEETISDTSDIPQRLFSGQFTRFTIKLYIDDCYLFNIPIKDVKKVVAAEVRVHTDGTPSTEDEVHEIPLDNGNKR